MTTKTCNKCKTAKPLSDFHKNPQTRDKRQPTCKVCTSARKHFLYQKNRASELEYQRDYRKKNREAVNANLRRYYKENSSILKAKKKAKYASDPQKYIKQTRAISLKARYGITASDYEDMLKRQNGMCAICSSTKSGRKDRRLMVDHCHKTKEVRGLLCHHCNALLGNARDNPKTLELAIKYLEKSTPCQ